MTFQPFFSAPLCIAIVVIFFFLCWCPYHSQRLLFAFLTLTGGWNTQISYVHYYLWLTSGEDKNIVYRTFVHLLRQPPLISAQKKAPGKKYPFSNNTGFGYYLSCCINPLVYCIMSRRFRRGFANVFACAKFYGNTSWNSGGGLGKNIHGARL